MPEEEIAVEMPVHAETTNEPAAPEHKDGVNWGVVVSVAIPAAIVLVIVALHLTGVVGPAAH